MAIEGVFIAVNTDKPFLLIRLSIILRQMPSCSAITTLITPMTCEEGRKNCEGLSRRKSVWNESGRGFEGGSQ